MVEYVTKAVIVSQSQVGKALLNFDDTVSFVARLHLRFNYSQPVAFVVRLGHVTLTA